MQRTTKPVSDQESKRVSERVSSTREPSRMGACRGFERKGMFNSLQSEGSLYHFIFECLSTSFMKVPFCGVWYQECFWYPRWWV